SGTALRIEGSPRVGLLGRQREQEALRRLLDSARAGRGGVLVMHGDPGVGKTALLEQAVETGLDFRVVRADGVEGERGRAFVARRLLAERIAFVFAARELGDALTGFPEVHVGPLGHRDARALLESVLPGRLDDRVVERIVVETRGNPLALLELPRGLSPAQL